MTGTPRRPRPERALTRESKGRRRRCAAWRSDGAAPACRGSTSLPRASRPARAEPQTATLAVPWISRESATQPPGRGSRCGCRRSAGSRPTQPESAVSRSPSRSLPSLCRRRNAGTSSGETGSNSAPGPRSSRASFDRRRQRQRQVEDRAARERHARAAAGGRDTLARLLLPGGVRVQIHRRLRGGGGRHRWRAVRPIEPGGDDRDLHLARPSSDRRPRRR